MSHVDVKLILRNQQTIMRTLQALAGNYYSDHREGRDLTQHIGASSRRITAIEEQEDKDRGGAEGTRVAVRRVWAP